MQTTSDLYKRIVSSPNHWFETTVVIGDSGDLITERGEKILFGGVAIIVARDSPESGFGEEQLFSVRTSHHMFNNTPEFGKAIASEIEVVMINPAGDIPTMAQIVPYVKACTENEESEWVQQGAFYVDTREVTHNSDGLDVLTLRGFDAMLKTDQYYDDSGLNWTSGSVSDITMVQGIADQIGVSVDRRTWDVMTDNYQIPIPFGYKLREILGYIAGAYAGCFIMTGVGELRLVSVLELPEESNLLTDKLGDYLVIGMDRIKLTYTGG